LARLRPPWRDAVVSPAPVKANVIPVQAVKAFKRSGGTATLIPDGADWSAVSSRRTAGAHCQIIPHLAQRFGMGGAVTPLRSTTLWRALGYLYPIRTDVSSCGL